MATVSSTLALQDKMSPTLTSVTRAMNSTLAAMRSIKGVELGPEFAKAAADVRLAENALDQMNRELQETPQLTNRAGDGFTVMKGLAVGAMVAIGRSIKNAAGDVVGLTDQLTGSAARINLIAKEGETVAGIQQEIFLAAQRSRGEYLSMVDVVAKLGITASRAFGDTREIVAFTELLNKNFIIAGASAQEMRNATYQLTQAMASGRLQGDEFRSILENAPLLAQAIENYVKELGHADMSLKDMSSAGLLTADVIKAALFSTADDVNARFAQMPMTIGQIATVTGNVLLQAFMPALQGIGRGAQWVYENWDKVAPVFYGVAGGIGAAALAWGVYTAAQWIATGALSAFIATMLASPITWIAIGIGIIIMELYKWVQAVGGVEIAWIKATDGIYNAANIMAEGVILAFNNMVNHGINGVNILIGALNAIPGVDLNLIQRSTLGMDAATALRENRQARAGQSAVRIAEIQAEKAAQAAAQAGPDWPALTVDIPGGKALKTSSAEPVKIDGDDIKMMLDIAADKYRPFYQTLTPQIALNVDTIRESADIGQVLEVAADWLEEVANSNLRRPQPA